MAVDFDAFYIPPKKDSGAPTKDAAAPTDAAVEAAAPTNSDGIQNGTETDIDCGGDAPTDAGACSFGKKCGGAGDCTTALRQFASQLALDMTRD